ncbi:MULTISPECIES: CHAD domain-containing protein [Asticcacaulis]|uniref:CHAD domain-containing protein n=1 Tax=Asticcacaulis TaxID=76890 RepID=UPI001AE1AFA5|nr:MULTISPECIES: CHAD domain-containing protein [Asticcacaulis]MBP2161417.1 CHAD domain-containing protein [Asticcacaulis solisilvae]MDR6802462.1 CHAD domain-containing protein [Asticcacaulis sp. BE141]
MTVLEKWDDFEDGVRRVILEQLDDMDRASVDDAGLVHALRLSCKKIRAWLRLLRDALGDEAFKSENRIFRDLSRRLSVQRDADVLHESVESLRDAFPGEAHAGDISAARSALPDVTPENGNIASVLADVAVIAADARQRIAELPLERRDRKAALKQAYRKSCRREKKARRAARDLTADNLHEWRKQVKALYYQIQLVRDVWPKRIRRLGARLKTLAKTLGHHHDLAVLEEQLLASHMPLPPQRLQSIRKLIHHRLEAEGNKAVRQGRKVSRASCGNFTKGLARRWKTWAG